MKEFTFYEKDGYISPSLSDLYDVTGESDLEPICWTAPAFQLVEARHKMPLDMPAIFKSIDDVMDFDRMFNDAYCHLNEYESREIVVYITGLTAAALAVVSACRELGITPIFMHYNRADGRYYPQFM